MKKYRILIICFAVGLALILSACTNGKMMDYYMDRENYICASGTVSHISYSDDGSEVYIGFEDLSFAFDDTCFKIVGDNFLKVKEQGIESVLKPGVTANFVTAPKYFGDGYVMPIVAITIEGNIMLEEEDGYANLIKWLQEN